MNNMYDILAKINLLEGRGSKPDFLDIDRDGDRKEPMKKAASQAKQLDELSPELLQRAQDAAGARNEKIAQTLISKDPSRAGRAGRSTGEPTSWDNSAVWQAGHEQWWRLGNAARRAERRDAERQAAEKQAAQAAGTDMMSPAMRRKIAQQTAQGQLDELSPNLLNRAWDAARDRRDQIMSKGGHERAATDPAYKAAWDAQNKQIDKFRKGFYKAQKRDDFATAGHMLSPAMRRKMGMAEADMEEGNEFSGARLAAIRAGKPTFTVDGKTYRVSGDTSDEKAQINESQIEEGFADFFDKKQMYRKIGADVDGKEDDYTVTFKDGTRKRYQNVDGKRRVTTLEPIDRNDAVDDEGETVKRGRGRPKGTGKKMGARGKTKVNETDLEEDYDKDEYDEEGEMAMSQARTIEDAAKELQDILDADENLPEWVQKKIAIAQEYIDSARDYLKANRPEGKEEMDVEVTGDEEVIPERELTKSEMKKREEIVKSMKKDKAGFEKRYGDRGEAVMYATATKQAKKTAEAKDEDKEEVEETTVAGSVATAPAGGKANGIFGKGVYESQIAESFDNKLKSVLNEGMSINMSMDENGTKSLSVNATEDDAVKLAQILRLAGMEASGGTCASCGGMHEGECEMMEGDLANSGDDTEYMDTDYMVNTISAGLNGRKTTGQTTGAPFNRDPARSGAMTQAELAEEKTVSRLMDLYKRIDNK